MILTCSPPHRDYGDVIVPFLRGLAADFAVTVPSKWNSESKDQPKTNNPSPFQHAALKMMDSRHPARVPLPVGYDIM